MISYGTSDKLTSWTMAPPPACRSFPKNKPPRSPPNNISPKHCIQDGRGGRGSAANNQITMTTAAADMLANGNDDDGNSDDGNGDDGNGDDGNGDYNDNDDNGSGGEKKR